MPLSKPLRKTDEEGKQLIIDLLGDEHTHGGDVDSYYYTPQGWVFLELLKCDAVHPFNSHPNRYWFNSKKFVTLWALVQQVNGKLYLVNYERTHRDFRVMLVAHVNRNGLAASDSICCGFTAVKNWLRRLNDSAVMPPEP